jgi:hypothetical protein
MADFRMLTALSQNRNGRGTGEQEEDRYVVESNGAAFVGLQELCFLWVRDG